MDLSTITPQDGRALLREHYNNELRRHFPDLFQEAHRRIYEHLCTSTKEGNQPMLEDLKPLYQAVGGAEQNRVALYDIAFNHLTLGRAGQQQYLLLGLLTRVWLRFLASDPAGSARDRDEAWEIAERGSMKLFMADIYLSRARLFGRMKDEVGSRKGEG